MQNQDLSRGAASYGNTRQQPIITSSDAANSLPYYTEMQNVNINYHHTDNALIQPSSHINSHINRVATQNLSSLATGNQDELTDLHMSLTGGRYLPYQPIPRADIHPSAIHSIDHEDSIQYHTSGELSPHHSTRSPYYNRSHSAFPSIMHPPNDQQSILSDKSLHTDELGSYFPSFPATSTQHSEYNNSMMSALTLTALINTPADEMLNSLTTEQLIELEKNVRRLKRRKEQQLNHRQSRFGFTSQQNFSIPSNENQLQNRFIGDFKSKSQQNINNNRQSSTSNNHTHSTPSFPQGDTMSSICNTPSITNNSSQMNNVSNLPASQPVTLIKNGVEHLVFTYSTRGNDQEYTIRSDIDSIRSEDLPEEFRRDNCVYPRACVPLESYVGNRYEYETTVNDIAWRLTWLNRDLLTGKRGLIQRAVDSYRNRFQESRSRRVVRQEKINNGTLRRRAVGDSNQSTQLTSRISSNDMNNCNNQSYGHGTSTMTQNRDPDSGNYITIYFEDLQPNGKNGGTNIKCLKLRADVDRVNLHDLNDTFKLRNCLYPTALDSSLYTQNEELYYYENELNEIGWKLAFLNATKLAGRKDLLMTAVDAFRSRYPMKMKNEGYSTYSHDGLAYPHFDSSYIEGHTPLMREDYDVRSK